MDVVHHAYVLDSLDSNICSLVCYLALELEVILKDQNRLIICLANLSSLSRISWSILALTVSGSSGNTNIHALGDVRNFLEHSDMYSTFSSFLDEFGRQVRDFLTV